MIDGQVAGLGLPGMKLTGDADRDVRVVNELATLNWGDVTKKGPPSGFPD